MNKELINSVLIVCIALLIYNLLNKESDYNSPSKKKNKNLFHLL